MLEQVRPCAEVAVHILADNSAVVFNEATQQLFSFDPLATYLWCRWEDGAAMADLVAALDTSAGTNGTSAQEMVDRCLSLWQTHQLIGDGQTPDGSPQGERTRGAEPDLDRPPAAAGSIATSLQIGGVVYGLCYGDPALAEMMRPLLAPLEIPAREVSGWEVSGREFLLTREGERYVLRQDGDLVEFCEAADEVAPMVKFCLNVDLLETGDYRLAFHSAAVVRNGRALLLPAASGRGKSTLTALLLHDGWDYLSDDSALLCHDEAGQMSAEPLVRGVGFDLCLKESAWDLLQPWFPAIEALPIYRRGDGHRVRYLPPPVRLPDPGAAYPIGWLIFPHFQPGRTCELAAMTPPVALQHLLSEAFAPSQRLSRGGFEILARLVEEKSCHRLTYGAASDAVGALRHLCQ